MEKDITFLSEIKNTLKTLKEEIEILENKISEYEQSIDNESIEPTHQIEEPPMDLDVDNESETNSGISISPDENTTDIGDIPETNKSDGIINSEKHTDDDFVDNIDTYDTVYTNDRIEIDTAPVIEDDTDDDIADDIEDDTDGDIDGDIKDDIDTDIQDKTDTHIDTAPEESPIIDSYADRQSWRKAIPGPAVNDIKNAISLNDRILFINTLFGEDSLKFQNTITELNAMNTLEEVLEMIAQDFPEWDLDSETVYRFMMAVRRHIK